jgi:hypothetical protein
LVSFNRLAQRAKDARPSHTDGTLWVKTIFKISAELAQVVKAVVGGLESFIRYVICGASEVVDRLHGWP